MACADCAKKAGAQALIVTLDWSFATRRDWESPPIPEKRDLKAMIKFAPEGILRPKWTLDLLRNGGLPNLTTPNLAAPGEETPTFFGAYGEWMFTPLPSWDDIKWLREEWGGLFVVKGIMHPDDARRAVDIGATAISVSNHGATTSTAHPPRSARYPGSSTRSATRWRSCSTAGSGAAATS